MRVLSILSIPHPKGRSWSTKPTRERSRKLIHEDVSYAALRVLSKFYAKWASRSIIVPAEFCRGALNRVSATGATARRQVWRPASSGPQPRFRTGRQAGTRDRFPGCDRLIGLKKQQVPGMIKSSHAKRNDC